MLVAEKSATTFGDLPDWLNYRHIADDIFRRIFLNENCYILMEICS